MNQTLRGLFQIPLDMATNPGTIIENAQAFCDMVVYRNRQSSAGCDGNPDARADERTLLHNCAPPAAPVFGLPAAFQRLWVFELTVVAESRLQTSFA
jgi:hypothetical protein